MVNKLFNNFIKVLICVMVLFIYLGCSSDIYYTVKFINYDNTVLYRTKVKKGSCIEAYEGEIPTAETTYMNEYILQYEFIGWDKEFSEINSDTTYIAQYEVTKIEYIYANFYNYDQTLLEKVKLLPGETPKYTGKEPTKASDDNYNYYFAGWDKEIKGIVTNTDYNALYDSVSLMNVIYKNYDGKVLYETKIEVDETPVYEGSEPTRKTENKIKYLFKEWVKDSSSTADELVYIATYNEIQLYNIVFKNYDGDILYEVLTEEGRLPIYVGQTPSKEETDDIIYDFDGWNKELSPATQDTEYTATFEAFPKYTVIFMDQDDNILYEASVKEGETAEYYGQTPYKASYTSGNYKYTYTFKGWSKSLTNVTSDMVVYAQFTEEIIVQLSDQDRVKQHLNNYGSGTYHNVSTGGNTTLGYSGSYFYLGYASSGNGFDFVMSMNFTYGSSGAYASLYIYQYDVLVYKGNYYVTFSNHRYGYFSIISVDYTSLQATSSIASAINTIASETFSSAVNNTSSYLYNYGLPYIN